MIPEPLRVTLAVAKALERMGIPYFVGGSLASSAHGVARATLDADIVAKLDPGQAGRFAKELGPEFYADVVAIADAVARRSSFNVIHLPTAFKVDVFVPRATAYADVEMERRQSHVIDHATGERLAFSTAEDTLLAKLQWYRQGNEVSERQWRDVLGILRVTGQGLDGSYLSLWAGELGVTDLLDRALREA
ncbi:MAG: hypothetical protein MUQ56_15025, partial [Thermoleophilia bacterium]|nr:hypothetical protein [Thermoleophilia bacterium]